MKTKQTCTRCGGSGNYSFNLRHGTVCYGCNGAGHVFVDCKKIERARVASEKAAMAAAEKKAKFDRVAAELNASYNFDLTTAGGIDKLNFSLFKATGKDLWKHVKEAA